MTGNKVAGGYQSQPSTKNSRFQRDIPRAQEIIYSHLLEIVKTWEPDEVLEEFKHLFIHHVNTVSSNTLPSLYEIVFSNQEHEFRNTLKRSCYILINNWDISRNHKFIQKLIQIFEDPVLEKNTMSPTLQRLRSWLRAFINSKDFEELKLFAARYEERDNIHWSERYTSYLLVPQYIDLNNPIEQRQAARALSKQLKDQFKFELAMYTARSEAATTSKSKLPRNPTGLGDDVLRLIKAIVAKRGVFGYVSLANIFVNQTQNQNYRNFKKSLQKYLAFSVERQGYAKNLKTQLAEKLDTLYADHHDKPINDALLLRTCNRVIEYITTENHVEPSALFILLLSHGSPLTLVVILLKIVLICKYSHTHLEARIAELILYYKEFPEAECKWVVNFFEIFRITMAIYTENVEFNLVNMQPADGISPENSKDILDACRIFSQPKYAPQLNEEQQKEEELKELELELTEVLAQETENTSDP
jgi:hypothetical protein